MPRTEVYPRVGGGNRRPNGAELPSPGLSPRGRGKPDWGIFRLRLQRSIPAWAGETKGKRYAANGRAVYPRVGGGNQTAVRVVAKDKGLSPRGRGKRPAAAAL